MSFDDFRGRLYDTIGEGAKVAAPWVEAAVNIMVLAILIPFWGPLWIIGKVKKK